VRTRPGTLRRDRPEGLLQPAPRSYVVSIRVETMASRRGRARPRWPPWCARLGACVWAPATLADVGRPCESARLNKKAPRADQLTANDH